jgi:hypothetical protein
MEAVTGELMRRFLPMAGTAMSCSRFANIPSRTKNETYVDTSCKLRSHVSYCKQRIRPLLRRHTFQPFLALTFSLRPALKGRRAEQIRRFFLLGPSLLRDRSFGSEKKTPARAPFFRAGFPFSAAPVIPSAAASPDRSGTRLRSRRICICSSSAHAFSRAAAPPWPCRGSELQLRQKSRREAPPDRGAFRPSIRSFILKYSSSAL